MNIETKNFINYTASEYCDNLLRLGINSHSSLIGETVYYVKPQYGKHIVKEWNSDRAEYLLELDGDKFWSNPFNILNINN